MGRQLLRRLRKGARMKSLFLKKSVDGLVRHWCPSCGLAMIDEPRLNSDGSEYVPFYCRGCLSENFEDFIISVVTQ